MSPKGTVFFDEWQACLRAHYLHVLRTGDHVTEPTLRRVLRHSGLTDEDIAALHREAQVEPAPPEPEDTRPPAPIEEPEAGSASLDDDELLRGDDLDLPDDAPPIPSGPPPPSQLSLF